MTSGGGTVQQAVLPVLRGEASVLPEAVAADAVELDALVDQLAGSIVGKGKFLLAGASSFLCPAALPGEAATCAALLHLVWGGDLDIYGYGVVHILRNHF